jgi:hypothetical protein
VNGARHDDAGVWPPLHETGISPAELDFHGGGFFWEEVRAFTDPSPLAFLVQTALAGPGVPRVWVFLDEPEETTTRAAAALAAARALIARRLNVIVVDADDRHPDLTRWSGRHEHEGWIDFVRYGASLAACAVPLPWEGASGRLLGVGSFTPVEVTGAEVSWLLSLLGGQADVVLVTAPLGPAGAAWTEIASLRLLCWDRGGREPAQTRQMLTELAVAGVPADAVIAFGAPGLALLPAPSPEAIAAQHSLERFAAAVAAAAGGNDAAAPVATVVPAAGDDAPPGDGAAAAVARAVGGGSAPSVTGAPASIPALKGGGPPFRPPRGRWLAVAGLVAIVAAAGWLATRAPRARVPLSSLAPPVAGEDISAPAEAGGAPDTLRMAAAVESLARAPVAVDSTVKAIAGTPIPAPEAPVDTVGRPAPSPADSFDPAPFRLPVGRDGWVLHVYSQPDSLLAQRQVASLARAGYTSDWRSVELPGKGRWYRIYMGSFPSRAAAEAALPTLLRRLGETWGQATRY